MAADTLLCSASPGERRLALIEGGRVAELVIARPGQALGGIWKGRVVAVDRRLKAAFVEIGLERPGLLSGAEVSEGQAVTVQALADPLPGKGAKLTTAISLTGRWAALTPSRPGAAVSRRIVDADARRRLSALAAALVRPGEGLVLRTAAADAADDAIAAEVATLRARWQRVAESADSAACPTLLLPPDAVGRLLADHPGVRRLLVDDDAAFAELRRDWPDLAERHRDGPVFDLCDAEEDLARALAPLVPLPSGGSLLIEQTATATLVDVNSGGGAIAEANAEAVAELARQLRLRTLSGRILFDAIPGGGRGRLQRLIERLRNVVADDPVPTHVVGATPLGLVEITRERRRASLAEIMLARRLEPTAETVALSALRALLREAGSPGRPTLHAAPAVAAALARLSPAMAETERRLGRAVTIVAAPSPPGAGYALSWTWP